MSKIVIIAVFIFWIAVSVLFANKLINKDASSPTSQNFQNTTDQNTDNSSQASPGTGLTLTLATVSQHNTAGDCWVTAGSNVYDVTNFIFQHPGGSNRIIPYCGSDVAAAFSAQGHSSNAQTILASMKIGAIGSSITAPSASPTPINTGGSRQGDDDDEEEFEDD